MASLYLDTSVVLRAVVEAGSTPALEKRIAEAQLLVTSRLVLVEASRALIRLRLQASAAQLARAEREIELIWSRCGIWELTPEVCALASHVAPQTALRTLDALHLATFQVARRQFESLELVTADRRLADSAGVEAV